MINADLYLEDLHHKLGTSNLLRHLTIKNDTIKALQEYKSVS